MHLRLPTPLRLFALVTLVLVGTAQAVPASALPTPVSAVAPGRPQPAPAGSAVWPLDPVPEVVRGFDPPAVRGGVGHRGVDLAGSPGQPVRAALGGTVTYAGRLAGRGVVVVDHGLTRTTYEPVEATVHVGDRVAAGDRIGRLQSGGSHCAPAACLHWGWIDGEEYLDPLTLVGAGPVRLLPLNGLPAGSVRVTSGARLAAGGSDGLPEWARMARAAAPSKVSPPVTGPPQGVGALFRSSGSGAASGQARG